MGTCHKCGSSRLVRTAICSACGCRYHTVDCGGRYTRAGEDPGVSSECPRCTCACLCNGGSIQCHAGKQTARRAFKQRQKTLKRKEVSHHDAEALEFIPLRPDEVRPEPLLRLDDLGDAPEL